MAKLTQKSPEVFLAEGPVGSIGPEEIELLRAAVAKTPKRRARINAHPGSTDPLHEMVIAIEPGSYIRPHKHPAKSESFHIIEGMVDVVVLDEAGEITQIVALGDRNSGRAFYYRMSAPLFHTLIIRSPLLVMHEITNGPFEPGGTVFAEFAPPETETAEVSRYMADIEARAAAFGAGRA